MMRKHCYFLDLASCGASMTCNLDLYSGSIADVVHRCAVQLQQIRTQEGGHLHAVISRPRLEVGSGNEHLPIPTSTCGVSKHSACVDFAATNPHVQLTTRFAAGLHLEVGIPGRGCRS